MLYFNLCDFSRLFIIAKYMIECVMIQVICYIVQLMYVKSSTNSSFYSFRWKHGNSGQIRVAETSNSFLLHNLQIHLNPNTVCIARLVIACSYLFIYLAIHQHLTIFSMGSHQVTFQSHSETEILIFSKITFIYWSIFPDFVC